MTGRSPTERFLAFVDVPLADDSSVDGLCWLWTGACDKDGYGVFWVDGRTAKANRYSYELAYGPLDKGLEACHTCDNPPCVRPHHLYAGTHFDNMNDMVIRGRARGGRPLGS